jgi:hypothetical protein
MQKGLIQTSQTGGQQYSSTSPFSHKPTSLLHNAMEQLIF